MEVRINGVKYVPVPDLPDNRDVSAALELRFDSDVGDNLTVRDYLRILLLQLWAQQEGFSGKRPFGNSGWEYDLLFPLAKAGFVDLGPMDEDGEPYNWAKEQKNAAMEYVSSLIVAAFHGTNHG